MERLGIVFVLVSLALAGSTPHETRAGSLAESWTASRSQVSTQWCQYRDFNVRYDAEVFRLQSSFGCYDYNAKAKFAVFHERTTNSRNGMPYWCLLINGTKVDVDYLSAESTAVVADSFKSQKDTDKWKSCSKTAEDCCRSMLDTPSQQKGCPATWDGWSCWQEAGNETWSQEVCPDYIYSGTAPSCYHMSSKECLGGGWNVQTDYSTCDITQRLKARIRYHVIVLGVSLCVALPAILIFFVYRSLRASMRVVLHRNLLLAISARNVCTIVSKRLVLWDALVAKDEESSVLWQNGVPCRALAVLEKLAANGVFACMLLLGIFLHRLIAKAFRGEPNMRWYFVLGTAATCLPALAWAVATAILYDANCWVIDAGGLQWINDSVRIAMLAVNFFLILDIIRVLVTKLRTVKTGNSDNVRRTIKATIWLVPVFGVQFIFTSVRPKTTDCLAEQVFYFFSYGLDGFQGAVVALLFCYFNKEVQILLKKTFLTTREKIRTRLNPNHLASGHHRNTVSTTADPPPSTNVPTLDTTCVQLQRKINKVDPWRNQEVFFTPRNSTCSDKEEFFTPRNSVTSGSLYDSGQFYSPRSSISGVSGLELDYQFFDCIEPEIELSVVTGVFDNRGFEGATPDDSLVLQDTRETVA